MESQSIMGVASIPWHWQWGSQACQELLCNCKRGELWGDNEFHHQWVPAADTSGLGPLETLKRRRQKPAQYAYWRASIVQSTFLYLVS